MCDVNEVNLKKDIWLYLEETKRVNMKDIVFIDF